MPRSSSFGETSFKMMISSFFGRLQIQVCILEHLFNKDLFGDTNIGFIFFLDVKEHLHLGILWWPLMLVRLKEGQLPSKIATWC